MAALDAFHAHEVLHGTAMVQEMFDCFIEQHRFTQSDAELKEAAERIGEALGNFYQLVGRKTMVEG